MAKKTQRGFTLKIGFLLFGAMVFFGIGWTGFSAAVQMTTPNAMYLLGVIGTLFCMTSLLFLGAASWLFFVSLMASTEAVANPISLQPRKS